MSEGDLSDAERRVWARLPPGTASALDGLSSTDLQTLLLSVARRRAASIRPVDVLRRWRVDRFVRPAATDPRVLAAVEARLWRLLPDEVHGVELSPVVPTGTCSALGPVSQNRIVTTMRSSEVLSDATNALAVEAADRRRRRPDAGPVHLAACHRHLRAQRFAPGWSAHFRLFALVSSARDVGSGIAQARMLTLHLGYWRRVLAALVPAATPRLLFTIFGGGGTGDVLRERFGDTVLPALTGVDQAAAPVPLMAEPDRERGRGYYADAALRMTLRRGDETVEVGDGGFTTWTAQLMSDAKERCLVSCLATEQLAALVS